MTRSMSSRTDSAGTGMRRASRRHCAMLKKRHHRRRARRRSAVRNADRLESRANTGRQSKSIRSIRDINATNARITLTPPRTPRPAGKSRSGTPCEPGKFGPERSLSLMQNSRTDLLMTNQIPNGMPRGAPQQVSDTELLDVADATPGPSFTVREIADQTSIGTEWVRNRLQSLQDSGLIDSKLIGRQRVYWFEQDG